MRHPARRAFFHVVDTMDAAAAVEKSGAAANKFYQGRNGRKTEGRTTGRRTPDADGWTDKVFITVSIIYA